MPNTVVKPTIEIEIDGTKQTLTSEDVVNLKAQQASATQKSQQVASILQAAEKFGMTPEQLLTQAEGAFSVMTDLIDRKLINEKGEILSPAADPPPARPDVPVVPLDTSTTASELKRIMTTLKGLEAIPDRLKQIENDQSFILRTGLSDKIKARHPELSDEDISRAFAAAMSDPAKKPVWDHAADLSTQKKTLQAQIRADHAKEFGINITEFDENKLMEQSGEGASAHFKGKKFSFRKGKRAGENSVSPMEAATEYLNRQAKK